MGCNTAMSRISSCRMAGSLPLFRTRPATDAAAITPIPINTAVDRRAWGRATRCHMISPRSARPIKRPLREKAPAPSGPGAFFRVHVACGTGSIIQNKGHGEVHLEFGDLAVFDHHVLILDPSTLEPAQGLRCALDPQLGGVVKTVGRCR